MSKYLYFCETFLISKVLIVVGPRLTSIDFNAQDSNLRFTIVSYNLATASVECTTVFSKTIIHVME